ncbi:hypothetical protein POJ06DRAFT_276942 [Lipomyces tetrasporus]|uniref:Sulfite reductase [NADPH] subunit beta n=1 Tax=Lipomyces tetrasporus TaxID=54092 RepID=A0AAD7VR28_9ASCO|nr:uncharacterized protein POJ06DRAFT_276942 [Lipomyces tetrasporus]KAJ8099517.1 hypothetical protein POJ06DRAFT_276942 [Lipomyces tetrasporus]
MASPIGFISTREDAAARVAYLFSETVLSVQPNLKASPSVGFQHALDQMVFHMVRGIVTKRGTLPSIYSVRHNADPFLTAVEELGKTAFLSITAASSTLPAAITHLAKLAKYPVVIHVSMSRSFADFSEIISLRQLGFTLIQSFSLREAQDLAIASHILAIRTGKGVIHFFHQPEGEETPIPFEDVSKLDNVVYRSALVFGVSAAGIVANKGHWNDTAGDIDSKSSMGGTAVDKTHIAQSNLTHDLTRVDYRTGDLFHAAEAVFDLIRVALGRTYKAFDYHGAGNADTALLIFGSSAKDFITAIGHAGSGNIYSKVGVITVRIYRPWSVEKLLATIPQSVERLGVLEQVHCQTTKWGPVLLDVISSLNSDLSTTAAIPVVGYQLGYLDSETIGQALRGIMQNIQSKTPIQNLLVGGPVSHDVDLEYHLSQTELETAYSKMLYSVFGAKLSILNSLDSNESGIPRTISSNPEYGFGAYLAKEEEKKLFVYKLQKAIKANVFTNQETKNLVLRWLLLSRESSSKLSEVGVELISSLESDSSEIARELLKGKAFLLGTTSWIIGSDAWSYDLGTSGVHNVIASGKNVNVLIVDSQPYTARAARDASHRKKDIGLYAMNYSNSYVASIAVYSSYTQALQALIEADKFEGPSIVIAYLPYNEETDSALTILQETKKAVDSGYWPLYRWDPRADESGLPNFQLDSQALKKQLKDFLERENHLSQLARRVPVLGENIAGSYGSNLRSQQRKKAKDAYSKLLESLTGPPLTILFASDGGTAENLAKRLHRRAKGRGFGAVVMAMDDFPFEDLVAEENLVIVISTAGQGEFPQNGRNFWESIKSSTDLDLNSVNYAVFGLGDSHYWPRKQDAVYYNKPSKDLNSRLEILGAKRIVELGLGNNQDPDGYQTAYLVWETQLWVALGVGGVDVFVDEPPPLTNEDIKIQSNYLRGTIVEGLNDESTGGISASDSQVAKFHGVYLQDDRDIREQRKASGLEPAYFFMIRVRMPAGVSTPAQWLAIDRIAGENGNHTFKITTRGTYQLHGVIKKNLKSAIKAINAALLDTIAACGDGNRNVLCAGLPHNHSLHEELTSYAREISERLLPRMKAYHEIWLTDGNDERKLVAGNAAVDFEPLYGASYLPRKFKVAIAMPPYNDVDVFAHDVGLIAIVDGEDKLTGFNVLAGGGMGITHNNKKTYPRTGTLLGYVKKEDVVVVCEKIMLIQRDNGDRKARNHARLQYTIDDMGIDVFRQKAEELLGFKFEEAGAFMFESNIDHFGWVKDERGLNHFTMFVENGRIQDTPDVRMKTGLREIALAMKPRGEFRLTGNQHVILSNIAEKDMPVVTRLIAEYKLDNLRHSGLRLSSSACVAFPTCGVAIAESERYLPIFISKLESYLEELGLRHDSVVLRMTGCPNGCVRPWLAEVAMVGKAYGAYNLMLGGGYDGQRLNKLYKSSVNEEQALELLKPLFKRWALERKEGEHFGDFLIRAGVVKPTLEGKTFHDDVAEEDDE